MKKLLLICLLCCVGLAGAQTQVEIKTNQGLIMLELYPDKAPITVKNFLEYARSGFYEGLIFHRVISGFMIQGGGFTPDLQQKETQKAITLESNNGLKNTTGTIAMARTGVPDSATSQFFINTADNHFLNYTASTNEGYGYAVFGKVIAGMDVVRAIESQATATRSGMQDVPVQPIIIEHVKIIGNGETPEIRALEEPSTSAQKIQIEMKPMLGQEPTF